MSSPHTPSVTRQLAEGRPRMFEITLERSFRAAHGLRHYKGTTEPIHEHDWKVWIVVCGTELDASGCLVDFLDLITFFDAAVAPWIGGKNMNELAPFDDPQSSPSAESVARVIYERVAEQLPAGVTLRHVMVEEERGCRATFYRTQTNQPEKPRPCPTNL